MNWVPWALSSLMSRPAWIRSMQTKQIALWLKATLFFFRFFQFDSAIAMHAVVAYRTPVMDVEWHACYSLAFGSCGAFGPILADQP